MELQRTGQDWATFTYSAQVALHTCKPVLAGKESVSLSFMGGPKQNRGERPILKRETIKSWTFVSDPASKYQSDDFPLSLRRLREEIERGQQCYVNKGPTHGN